MATQSLAVVAEIMPPATSETPHRHERATQFFYVPSGELTIKFADAVVVASAGEGVSVPAGVAHQAINDSAECVEFLAIAGPSNAGDRIDF